MSLIDVESAVDPCDVEPHIFAPMIKSNPRVRENVLRFAEDHELTVVFPHGDGDTETVDGAFSELSSRGIDAMLNTGSVDGYTSKELAEDEGKLDELVDRLLETVGVYADRYPEGRVFLWHEAPMFGDWTGEDHDERAESIVEHGPSIFAAQKRAINDRYPNIDVGIFVHNPFVAPPRHSKRPVFGRLMDGLREMSGDNIPDFTYCDMYRGYYEWEAGYEAVNEYLASVLSNARKQTGGRQVYYLGEAHTINNNYTPSKQSIIGTLRTAIETGVESFGWYLRGSFRKTHRRNFNPFLPTTGSVDQGGPYNSWTGSRDRLRWAIFLLLRETANVDAEATFDLWLYGDDFGFYDHRLSLESGGEWEFIGDFSGSPEYGFSPSTYGRTTVTAFCGLDAERYLTGGLDLRITSLGDEVGERSNVGNGRAASTSATLRGVYVLPHVDLESYVPEPEAVDLVESVGLGEFAFGALEERCSLEPDAKTVLSVAIGEADRPMGDLPRAPSAASLDRLRELEASDRTVQSDLFDLWVYGTDIGGATIWLADEDVTGYATRGDDPDENEVIVVRGLSRDDYWDRHRVGHRLDLRVEVPTGGRVRAVYAMPYGGTANVVTPEEAASIVEKEYAERLGQIDDFSLGSAAWPFDPDLEVYETELQLVYRRLIERGKGADITL